MGSTLDVAWGGGAGRRGYYDLPHNLYVDVDISTKRIMNQLEALSDQELFDVVYAS